MRGDNAKIWAVSIITVVVILVAGALVITGHSLNDLLAFAAIVVIPVITYFTTDARASINQVKEQVNGRLSQLIEAKTQPNETESK